MAQWDQIAQQIATTYYNTFDTGPKENVVPLYHPQAMMTFENNQVSGHDQIREVLQSKLTFQKIKHLITKVDSQPCQDGGVVILVTGRLQTDDDPPHAFSQTFVVKPHEGSLFIMHDIFRLSIHNN